MFTAELLRLTYEMGVLAQQHTGKGSKGGSGTP